MKFSVSLMASKKVMLQDVWILVASWAARAKNRVVILQGTRKEVRETADSNGNIIKVSGKLSLPDTTLRTLERSLLLFLRRHLPPPGSVTRSFQTGFKLTGNFSADSLRRIITASAKRWAKENKMVYGFWLESLQIFTTIRGGLTQVHVSGVFVLPQEYHDSARVSVCSALSSQLS